MQGFLGQLARDDVLNRADEHRPVGNAMSEAVQMLHDATGGHNPEREPRACASNSALHRRLLQLQVLRVHDFAKPLDCDGGSGLELANTVELVGSRARVLFEIRGEAAGMAEPLGLGQMVVGTLAL
jgi:hypothetical protein